MPVSIRALYLVATPSQSDDFGGEEGGDFSFDAKKLHRIAERVEKLYVFHSKDDPIVSFRHAEAYKMALPSAEMVTFDDKGHFLTEAFPELIESLREVTR